LPPNPSGGCSDGSQWWPRSWALAQEGAPPASPVIQLDLRRELRARRYRVPPRLRRRAMGKAEFGASWRKWLEWAKWRGVLTSRSPIAALPNRGRFFVDLLHGVTPFWRDRYGRWRILWECNFFGTVRRRFAGAPANLIRRNAAAFCASSPRRAVL